MKKIKTGNLAMIILLLLFSCYKASAQIPTYRVSVTNAVQTSPNTLEFDVFILRTGSVHLLYQTMQFGLKFDTMITWLNNGSTFGVNHHSYIAASIVPGTSELDPPNQPQTVSFHSVHLTNPSIWWADGHSFNMLAATGMSTGTDISDWDQGCTHPGTRIARFRMVSQVSDVNTTPIPFNANSFCNQQFSTAGGGNITNTVVTAYVNGATTGTPITNAASHQAYNTPNTCMPSFALNPPPVISSISPSTITAGVGQTLTITGSGFGSSRGTGNLSFKNANDGGVTTVQLDNLDWTNATWTNNLISVVLPSNTATGGPGGAGGVPGSGVVTVTNGLGQSGTSPSALNIECAIKNFTLLKKRAYLVGNGCVNGITFYYGSTSTPTAAQKSVIAAACSTWAALLNIDIKISPTPQSASLIQNGFSTIFVGGTANPTESAVHGFACSGNEVIVEGDITYNGALNWSYVLPGQSLPANTYDFYAHMLHAIGKVLGLENVIDAANGGSEVMNWSIPPSTSTITAANRTSLSSGGGNGSSGALNLVVIPSRNLVINSCLPYVQLVTGSTASPVISATASGACTNNPVTITCNANGVGLSYLWSNGATTNPILVSTPGNYSVTVTYNSASCTVSSNAVSISGLLPSIINTQPVGTSICAGGSGATFTCTGPAGSTYQWQRSIAGGAWTNVQNGTYYSNVTTATLTVNNAQYYNGSSQLYRCLVSQNSSCTAFSNPAALTVQYLALAPLASVYSNGAAVTLVGTPAGGVYSGPGVSSSTFTPSTAGVGYHTITYTKTGCAPSVTSQTIQVVACCAKTVTTNTDPGNICLDGNLTIPISYTALGTPYSATGFTAQLSNAAGSFASPVNIGTTTASGSGTISVTISSATPDGASYKMRVVSPDGTVTSLANQIAFSVSHAPCNGGRVGFAQQAEETIVQDISIYPNPANTQLTVELPSNETEYQIQLFDLSGKVFVSRLVSGKTSEEIDLSDFASGTYLVKLSSNDFTVNKKLLIIK
jgi:hypothetical protein